MLLVGLGQNTLFLGKNKKGGPSGEGGVLGILADVPKIPLF